MRKSELDNAFWRFAINFYAKAGAAELLLHWQDEYQLDVLMVLLMLYLDELPLSITNTELQQLLEGTQNWRNRIEVARSLRRDLKAEGGSLYQQAKQFELNLEQYYAAELYRLQQDMHSVIKNSTQQETNLAVYACYQLGAELSQTVQAELNRMVF